MRFDYTPGVRRPAFYNNLQTWDININEDFVTKDMVDDDIITREIIGNHDEFKKRGWRIGDRVRVTVKAIRTKGRIGNNILGVDRLQYYIPIDLWAKLDEATPNDQAYFAWSGEAVH